MLDEALEKSTGIRKIRTISEVKEYIVENSVSASKVIKDNKPKVISDYSSKSIEELWEICNKLGVSCKQYTDIKIQRMRLVMAIKKATQ